MYRISPPRCHAYQRGRPRKRGAYTCALTCIGGAAAHIGRAASNPRRARPGHLRWRAAGRKRRDTSDNEVTAAVFHAPMSALNAAADRNACEPSHTQSTPTERASMCRRGCVGAQSHTHTRARARTQHVGACV